MVGVFGAVRGGRAWHGIEHEVVDIAVTPCLARLEGAHHRMTRRMEMLGGVAVGRVVAASDVAADEAHPKVHPACTDRETFLAPASGGRDISDELQVGADGLVRHGGWNGGAATTFGGFARLKVGVSKYAARGDGTQDLPDCNSAAAIEPPRGDIHALGVAVKTR